VNVNHEGDDAKQPKRIQLANRDLYPHYLLTDVISFMDTFAKVDTDRSGDLDVNEWVQLFAILNKNLSEHQARNLFARLDENNDNYISVSELIPIVFSNLNAQQRKKVVKFVEIELKKKKSGAVLLTLEDVDQLFNAYDTEDIGFVPISLFRERMKSLLFEGIYLEFKDSIGSVANDEMVNQLEFTRLLKPYMA
jgi:Ca2+-binding EF-hand superfamily protein